MHLLVRVRLCRLQFVPFEAPPCHPAEGLTSRDPVDVNLTCLVRNLIGILQHITMSGWLNKNCKIFSLICHPKLRNRSAT